MKWRQFLGELPFLSRFPKSLPRHIDIRKVKEVQIVGFADTKGIYHGGIFESHQYGYAAFSYM